MGKTEPKTRFQAKDLGDQVVLQISFMEEPCIEVPCGMSFEATHTTARYLTSLWIRDDLDDVCKVLKQCGVTEEALAQIKARL